jgi:glycosyltransferase involved in cell wall biosynthesis
MFSFCLLGNVEFWGLLSRETFLVVKEKLKPSKSVNFDCLMLDCSILLRHMSRKKTGINFSFLRKPGTGIGQVALGVLGGLRRDYSDKNLVLFAEENSSEESLKKFEFKHFLPKFYKRDDLVRKIIWEMFLLPSKAKREGCEKFVSLYQCPTVFGKNVEHVMAVHDIIPRIFPEYADNWRKKLYWKLTERAIKKADKIVTISEHTKRDLVRDLGISEDKIFVELIDVDEVYKKEISNEDLESVLRKYDLKRGYIYSGGGLDKRKNMESLILAYKKLLDQNEAIPLLVISGKLMPELAPLITDVERLVQDLGISDKVRLLGFVDQEDLPAIYQGAKLFVYPSLYEGFGMPVLEAMNQGAPVLASSTSSIPEVGGDAAEYFDPENVDELAQKMRAILGDDEKLRELSQKGRERAKQFSWKGFVRELMN